MSEEKIQMPYRFLGSTGLRVSALSLGTWATLGVKVEEDSCRDIMEYAYTNGVNFFDCAETYGRNRGDAEIFLGRLLKDFKWERTTYVVATKLFWGGNTPNERGLSRKHIIEGAEKSLKRLQLDYVDLIYAHRPDAYTTIEEIVRGFTHLINEGKAFYWGTSEWSAQQITEAYWIARMYNLVPPSMEQPEYHLFSRQRIESEYLPLFKQPYGLGITSYSPLAYGVLTGKYNASIPDGSRFSLPDYKFLVDRFDKVKDDRIPKVQKLAEVATEVGCSLPQLAIAWVISNQNISSCILGASKIEQIKETIAAINVKLTPETIAKIEAIVGNKPEPVNTWNRL